MTKRRSFPEGFLWGAATAAYQIEGAIDADGKSESNWDRFSHTPGKIKDGTTADTACDHYHRWRSDVDLMKWLGLNAYRFSVSWPRILPEGKGRVNEKGVSFYSRLVDALLENGITPLVTVWHGDHPQIFDESGGWTNRAMIDLYADYAEGLFRLLGALPHDQCIFSVVSVVTASDAARCEAEALVEADRGEVRDAHLQCVAALAGIALFAPFQTYLVGGRQKGLEMEHTAHGGPVQGEQSFHDEKVAGRHFLKLALGAGVRGEIVDGPADGLTPAQGGQMAGQQPVFQRRRLVKIELPALFQRQMRKIKIVGIQAE